MLNIRGNTRYNGPPDSGPPDSWPLNIRIEVLERGEWRGGRNQPGASIGAGPGGAGESLEFPMRLHNFLTLLIV